MRAPLKLGDRARTSAVIAAMAACALVYILVIAHTPLAIYAAGSHDDGLYMSLGWYLSQGEWLGPFGQLTLVKGPGYPAFLAAGHWLGIPVSLAHALFTASAISFFVCVSHRFMRSYALSALLFVLLLWNPKSFSDDILRVVRDQIYYGQLLVFVAAFGYALFGAPTRNVRVAFGAVAGGFLGWLWFTREEGSWLIPFIALLVAVATVRGYWLKRFRPLVTVLIATGLTFGAVDLGVRTVNWRVYKKFVGLDTKEANFEEALRQIHGVRSGGVKAHVSVTRAARERIYEVSPTFAELKDLLDGPIGSGWSTHSCHFYPDTCGDIGSGWFVWALRDAAAAKGKFASPAAESAFFGRIAREISAACARRDLECSPGPAPELPYVGWDQVAQVPGRFADILRLLLFYVPNLDAYPSTGDGKQFDTPLQLLNFPLYTPPEGYTPALVIRGWFYQSGSRWMSVNIVDAAGSEVPLEMRRIASPDIAAHFADADAATQRFVIRSACNDACRLRIATDASEVDVDLAKLAAAPTSIRVDRGTFYVDASERERSPFAADLPQTLSRKIRSFVSHEYNLLFRPILALGVIAFVVATVVCWRRVLLNACYVMALGSWLIVGMRCLLLVIIDLAIFPAAFPLYLTPAYFFVVCGAVLSIAAAVQLLRWPIPTSLGRKPLGHPQ